MNTQRRLVKVLPLLAGGLLLSSPILAAVEAADSEQIAKLLSEAKTRAFQVKEDAVTMESFNRMNLSREAQKLMISQVRADINELAKTAVKLKDNEALGSPWQQQAIKRIIPFLDELNGYTSAVIEHLNGDVTHTFSEYKDYLEANADYATDLNQMISDFVDYGRSKDRMERLTTKLEISNR